MTPLPDMIQTAARASSLLHKEGTDAIIAFVQSQCNLDGGFRGRTQASDLYYTVFGQSCLIALNQPSMKPPADSFVAAAKPAELDFVHLASAARCHCLTGHPDATNRSRPFLARMEAFRSRDGGYHHQLTHAAFGTVYGAFLAYLTYQEAGLQPPRLARLHETLETFRTADGGYANETGRQQATATTTAAAILIQYWISGIRDTRAAEMLLGFASRAGGFRAFANAPEPDLLSTATSVYALRTIGDKYSLTVDYESFIELLWNDNGGFYGSLLDALPDVEYTFYALLALGCRTPI